MSRPDVTEDADPFDLYLMANLAQALGRHSVAVDFYARTERFVRVWRDAEPDLQHYADEAREGLVRLRGERR